MSQTQTKEEFERILKANEWYHKKFKELILKNTGRGGKDYEVILDYIDVRDASLEGTRGEGENMYKYLGTHRFNYLFYDELFEAFEKRVENRIINRNESPIARKYRLIKETVQTWLDKQGHDRCHYYPEIFEQLASILEIEASKDPALPPRSEFEQECRKYQDEIYEREK